MANKKTKGKNMQSFIDKSQPQEIDQAEPVPIVPEKKKTVTIVEHDPSIRTQLLLLREGGWSNNKIASKMGVASARVSQYLNPEGCQHIGDTEAFERKALDLLRNEARRQASGVETVTCDGSEEVKIAFEYIRKTNDVGMVLMESGDGKTRGIEPYCHENPTAVLHQVRMWGRTEGSIATALFNASPKKDYDNQTNRLEFAVGQLRGSDRFFIFDDAHKLMLSALLTIMDFHDETHCPVALVGTFELLEKLKRDPQLFSRIGLHYVINDADPRKLVTHMVRSLAPDCGGEFSELRDLCELVARQQGHFRSVHKQLKLAAELRAAKPKAFPTWVSAFRGAHTLLVRDYALS